MYRRILSTLLALCIVLGMLPISASAMEQYTPAISVHAEDVWDGTVADSYAGGSGTSQAPYLIATAEQLARVAEQVNSGAESGRNYRLLNDIYLNDVSAVSSWDVIPPQNQWIPIGSASSSFSGIFDGADHTIQGIYISTADNYQGLFGMVGKDSSIKNLSVEKSYIKGENYISGICGYTSSSFSNCHSDVTVIGNKYIGGIAGGAGNPGGLFGGSPVNVENCFNIGNITGQSYVGGLLGNATTGVFKKCYNVGAVTGTTRVGGIAGKSVESHNCWNIGDITGTDYVGGILGEGAFFGSDSTRILGCFNAGKILGKSYVGGLLGYASQYSGLYPATISNCYNVGQLTGSDGGDYVGGISGEGNVCKYTNCYNAGNCSLGNGKNTDAFFNSARQGSGNLYFLEGCCGANYWNGWPTIVFAKSSAEMQESAFVSTLNNGGSAWVPDMEDHNLGYPILSGIDYEVYARYIKQPDISNDPITFDNESYSLNAFQPLDITALIPNSNGFQENSITWSSSDESIVIVEEYQVQYEKNNMYAIASIYAVSTGVATITITLSDGRSADCKIIVTPNLSPDTTMQIGDTTTVIISGLNPMLSENDISWSVTDKSMLDVIKTDYSTGIESGNASVLVRATKIGTTTVTCSIKELGSFNCKIRVELDHWSFSNADTDNEGKWPAKNGYYITSDDYSRLISNLSNIDKMKITYASNITSESRYNIDGTPPYNPLLVTYGFIDWTGSCHGMSRWVCLVNAGILSPEILIKSSLYEVDKDNNILAKRTQSAINFYHFQQELSYYQSKTAEFMSHDQDEQLKELKTYAQKAENGGNPILIRFEWYSKFKENGACLTSSGTAHAVVGYGLESGNWSISVNGGEEILYTNRIRIYDCSRQGWKFSDCDLYFNDTEWCIPRWKIISRDKEMNNKNNNGRLRLVTYDVSDLNYVDYLTGNISTAVAPPITTLSTAADAVYTLKIAEDTYTISGLSVLKATNNKELIIFLDDNVTIEGEVLPSNATVILPNTNESYAIETSEDSINFSVAYENYFEAANVSSTGSVTFNPNGNITIEAEENTDFYVNITVDDENYALPWYTLEITGSNSSNISTELVDDGVILASNNLVNITIYGSNDQETRKLIFSTDEESVLVSEQENELTIWVDTDGDGEYETPLDETSGIPTHTITFDANGGTGSMENSTAADGTPYTLPSCSFSPPVDKVFDKWAIGSANSSITVEAGNNYIFTDDTTVYALWKDAPAITYTLAVTNGTGSGSYAPGTQISITANTAPAGKVFDKWITNNGGTFVDVSSSSTTFTMPASDVTVTATYKDSITPPAPPVPGHRHNWVTAWSNDSTHHWHECSASGCTITNDSGKNGYGTHVYDDDTDTVCNFCGYTRIVTPPAPEHIHNWAEAWTNNATHHWRECDASDCTITDNNDKDGYGVHIYDDEADTTCNTCGYIRIVTPPVLEHTHSWAEAWTNNATHHWHECDASDCTITNNNDKDDYDVHIYDDEADTTCNTCGYARIVTPPTLEHTHNWAEAWTNNATHHWHECDAGECTIIDNNDKDGYDVHIYDDDSDTTCNTCGYTRTVAPPTPPRPVDREETYYINIPKTDNGEIIPSTRHAEGGDRVTLTAHPYAGYELESITVTNVRGREITLRDLGNDRYSFTMPNSRVSVEASFTKVVKNTPNVPAEDEPFTALGTPGISGIVLNPSPMPFTDVHANNWFYNHVEYMWKHYLMSGVSDTQFAPDATTSRAMIWTVLARMNNIRTDVNPGLTWYERGMLWAMEQGVTDGTNPMDNITREQLATMLWRNAGTSGVSEDLIQFSDSGSVSDYALAAVRWAVANGILQGSNGKLNPKGSATRAQVAAMVMRYAERIGA